MTVEHAATPSRASHPDHQHILADLERELLSIDRDEKKLIKEIKDAARCAYTCHLLTLLPPGMLP